VDLPPPETRGDRGEDAERDRGRDILEVVAAGADDLEFLLPGRFTALGGHLDREFAGEILAGDRARIGHDVARRALGDDLAAMHTGMGSDVDHVIGGEDRVLVMLDHDDRVADIAQVLERFQQPGIVALVQADGGLIKHIEHAGEAGADLRGKPDALALAARQRAGIARQRQVIEADIVQELQPVADFLEDAHGDLVLLVIELRRQLIEPVPRHCGSTVR
jgi:hypothetical protein